jgi:hypothetical protein
MTYTATVALEKGGIEAAKVLSAAARIVASGGMYKIFKLSKLYTEGKLDNARGDNDSYIKAALEYFDESGRVSYVDGLNSRRSLDAVAKDLNSNVMGQSMKNINKFFDAYMDAFELSSRVAVYMVEKQRLLRQAVVQRQTQGSVRLTTLKKWLTLKRPDVLAEQSVLGLCSLDLRLRVLFVL